MKRTNLVLDERLLEEALRVSGERTYSRAVERALDDFVRRARARKILDLAGSGLWMADWWRPAVRFTGCWVFRRIAR
jgi:Arc/MetJ family transcription regulator